MALPFAGIVVAMLLVAKCSEADTGWSERVGKVVHCDDKGTCEGMDTCVFPDATGCNRFYQQCTKYQDGVLTIDSNVMTQLQYDDEGMTVFLTPRDAFYIKRDGTFLPVIIYDNGADDFEEGMVRVSIRGKIAYYDREFRQVIAPKYGWGWPFENGRALVCRECTFRRSGEHTSVISDSCGYIDAKGREIVPLQYPLHEAIGR